MIWGETPLFLETPMNIHEYFSYILDCTIASTILFKFEQLEDPEKWPDPKGLNLEKIPLGHSWVLRGQHYHHYLPRK